MIDFGVAIIVFIVTAACHVFIHNVLVSRRRASVKTVALFFPGLLALWVVLLLIHRNQDTSGIAVLDWWTVPLPRSAMITFIVLAVFYILYFGSAFFGDESPSSKIYTFLRKQRTASYAELKRLFSEKELIYDRLHDLVFAGFIAYGGGKYKITSLGFWFTSMVGYYRWFIGWKSSG